MQKEAINVYNPTDPLERAVQNTYRRFNDGWLSMASCHLAAKALKSLKMYRDRWLNQVNLLEQRVQYFFVPYMVRYRDQMVFPTHLLFLRDILENQRIDPYLHSPIVFVTRPIAHYLLREYPIHIYLNMNVLRSANKHVTFTDIGGLDIVQDQIVIPENAILDIRTDEDETISKEAVSKVCSETGCKIGVSLIGPGVFTLDDDIREIFPNEHVWDKADRQEGVVTKVEPGETGIIEVSYADGSSKFIPQVDFDKNFVVI